MDVIEFNNHINQMLEKVSKEQKQIFLLGDFNINLLNYNVYQPTNHFLDSLASNSIISYVLQPTLSDLLSSEIVSGNLTATISDYLPQFLFAPNIFSNPSYNKSNIFGRDRSKFNKESFKPDYFDKKCGSLYRILFK